MKKQEIKLASHNSWSFACERERWMRYVRCIARCQDRNILEQYEVGVRCFDLRLRWDDEKKLFDVSHGFVSYRHNYMLDLIELEKLAYNGEDIYIRVLLEDGGKADVYIDKEFMSKCRYLEKRFSKLRFFGGFPARKRWRENLYHFKTKEPSVDERHVSVSGKWWEFIPKRWAKKNNKRVMEESSSEFLMIDFV